MAVPFLCEAFAVVNGAAGTFAANFGFASVARAGAGDNTVTLNKELDTNEGVVIAVPLTATSQVRVVHTSDAAKQILQFAAAGAATDGNFAVIALRCLP